MGGHINFVRIVDAIIYKFYCGPGCDRTPGCGPHVPNICYCDFGGGIDIKQQKDINGTME